MMKKSGGVLRKGGYLSRLGLNEGLEGPTKLAHLGELLLQRGLISKRDLATALTEITGVPYWDCEKLGIDSQVLKLLPRAMAKRCCALPIEAQGTRKLVAAMAEPQNLQTIDELRFSTGMEIVPRLSFRDEIQAAIEKFYAAGQKSEPVAMPVIVSAGVDTGVEFVSSDSLRRNVEIVQEMNADLLRESTPGVRLLASLITTAAQKGASDIHLEPQAADTVVRLRVDGMLRDHQRIPRSIQRSVVSRIKILSGMDLAERGAPQNGRFLVKISGLRIDLRVSTLPTQNGEKVVVRLLAEDAPLQDAAALGVPPYIAEGLRRMLALPQGLILVTGPTGSGKSVTLYSCLHLLKKPSLNIVTVEDPIEYVFTGINQVQVNAQLNAQPNAKARSAFASSLRSILRQDPNVIMIDEIRDKETAAIAMEAAESGRLVLSTVHTNDAISAVTRLLDLGLPASQVATSVVGVIAQRLIRRLCRCHREVPASPEFISRLKGAGITNPPEMASIPVGCELCDLTGYKGRIGIFELFEPDDATGSAIRAGSRNSDLRTLAKERGMKLMQDYARDLVREGVSTLEEVLRVVPFESVSSTHCSECHSAVSRAFLFCPFCGEELRESPSPESRNRSHLGQGVAPL